MPSTHEYGYVVLPAEPFRHFGTRRNELMTCPSRLQKTIIAKHGSETHFFGFAQEEAIDVKLFDGNKLTSWQPNTAVKRNKWSGRCYQVFMTPEEEKYISLFLPQIAHVIVPKKDWRS